MVDLSDSLFLLSPPWFLKGEKEKKHFLRHPLSFWLWFSHFFSFKISERNWRNISPSVWVLLFCLLTFYNPWRWTPLGVCCWCFFTYAVGDCYRAAYSILLFVLTCLACCLPSLCRWKIGDKDQFSLPHPPPTGFQELLGFCFGGWGGNPKIDCSFCCELFRHGLESYPVDKFRWSLNSFHFSFAFTSILSSFHFVSWCYARLLWLSWQVVSPYPHISSLKYSAMFLSFTRIFKQH